MPPSAIGGKRGADFKDLDRSHIRPRRQGCALASSTSAYHTENRSAILRKQSDEVCGLFGTYGG
jgi:hypothetical protein